MKTALSKIREKHSSLDQFCWKVEGAVQLGKTQDDSPLEQPRLGEGKLGLIK